MTAPWLISHCEQSLLDAEQLLGIHITIHDLGGIFHDLEGLPLLGVRRQSHRRFIICEFGFGKRCLYLRVVSKVSAVFALVPNGNAYGSTPGGIKHPEKGFSPFFHWLERSHTELKLQPARHLQLISVWPKATFFHFIFNSTQLVQQA